MMKSIATEKEVAFGTKILLADCRVPKKNIDHSQHIVGPYCRPTYVKRLQRKIDDTAERSMENLSN